MSASRSPSSQHLHEELAVFQALTPDQVREAQRLRYQVFAEEQGARLPMGESGLDSDCFDAHCRHLLVRDARSHTAEYQRAFSLLPLPIRKDARATGETVVPALLGALLGLGAQICGDPCWDPTFNNADLFWLLHRERLSLRAGHEDPAQATQIVAEGPRCSCVVPSWRKRAYNS